MKKKAGIIAAAAAGAAALFFLFLLLDLHVYRTGTRRSAAADGGLLFSVTAFDGAGESEPFVPSLGHAWAALDNRTDHPVRLNDRVLAPGEQLTVSVWAIGGHFGLYYDLEPAFIRQYGRYAGRRSIAMPIGEGQLRTIEAFLARSDRWTFLHNCSYFTVSLWNALADKDDRLPTQWLMYTPARLRRAIDEFARAESDMAFDRAGAPFFYLDGIGTELTLS